MKLPDKLEANAATLRAKPKKPTGGEEDVVVAVVLCEEWREIGDVDAPMPETPEEAWAYAERLVMCWNMHDELVSFLETMLDYCWVKEEHDACGDGAICYEEGAHIFRTMEAARAALGKARRETISAQEAQRLDHERHNHLHELLH